MKKQDQRVRLTENMIKKAFTELLKQKPIQRISIKELCEKADVSRGTFYSHYTDIYDLLGKMEGDMLREFVRIMDLQLKKETREMTPLKVTTGIFQCIKENADLCTVTLGPYGDKEFAAKLIQIGQERCLETYLCYFEGASQKQIELYYAFVSAGCIAILEKWMAEDMVSSAEEMALLTEDIMMYGIGFFKK